MGVARGAARPGSVEVTALVARARQGDAGAIQELFRAHLDGVHRVVHRLVGPIPEVDDLVQTVFVEAFRSLAGFRGDALFSTWLARIAVRVTMHAIRRRPPMALPLHEELDLPADLPGPERTVAAREGLALLDGLLAELRPKRRAAFVLHVLEGYAMDEVAAILNASTAAVKVRVHDARRHIERRMQRDPRLVEWLTREARP
jgi:RNA polymerase sigma-70 factor (ECF subfamily)